MAAPERFADMSDSSCTAGAVHTWPIARATALGRGVRLLRSTCRAPHEAWRLILTQPAMRRPILRTEFTEFSGDHSARQYMYLEIRGSPFAILSRNEAGTRISCCSKTPRFDSHIKGRRTK